MTPTQFVYNNIVIFLTDNHPAASADEVAKMAQDMTNMYLNLFLPNLQVDLETGKVSFVVPTP